MSFGAGRDAAPRFEPVQPLVPRLLCMTLCGALSLATTLPQAAAREARPRTTQDGIYTAQQAERGKQVYQRACAECHTLDWYQGDAMKPWDGAPLSDLLELIATLMPQGNPGSLKRREYLDIVAYILALNEMPAGAQELPALPDALGEILIKRRNGP